MEREELGSFPARCCQRGTGTVEMSCVITLPGILRPQQKLEEPILPQILQCFASTLLPRLRPSQGSLP